MSIIYGEQHGLLQQDFDTTKLADRVSETLVFPSYDGNGMFLSMGNITANSKVGMLFIDFETPHRVRVHGTASIDGQDPLTRELHGAELVARVNVTEILVNCPCYIHKYQRVQASKYAPQGDRAMRADTSFPPLAFGRETIVFGTNFVWELGWRLWSK